MLGQVGAQRYSRDLVRYHVGARRCPNFRCAFTRRAHSLLLCVVVALAACAQPRPLIEISGATMGTTYRVTVVGDIGVDEARLRVEIESALSNINSSMSTYDSESELSRLNANASTQWLPLSAPVYKVIAAALRITSQSGGAFDIRVAPLVDLWGFGPRGRTAVPSADALEATRRLFASGEISLQANPMALRKSRGDLAIDLSGIAKGYAVDILAMHLQRAGAENYLVEIGGELRALGRNARDKPWVIGIESPARERREIAQTISITKGAIASSGNYRNYFERDGQYYGHTIDPTTGAPVAHKLIGVTVRHTSAMEADAWATACMSMGFERAQALARELGLAVLFFVDEDGEIQDHRSAAFNDH